ncbi:hypothetical protein CROQUDRAFT_101713 [Cronartium quercuum f. sp. fusiforme G11]|uniref:DUF726-domain-containing protein n=1 Tax=Cronartium quercuum f. sp. fusiforme G11 TaxID=708437 RepID=A0A9P6N557_9BASI|nr:hypothetical protein CROQUDRAFT_101713 [Cronartium quercuum f. sp. fusiforme G11]
MPKKSGPQLNCSKWDPFHRHIIAIAVLYATRQQELIEKDKAVALARTRSQNSCDSKTHEELAEPVKSHHYLKLWFNTVLEHLQVDGEALPDQPTPDDLDALTTHLPSHTYLELLHDLVIISLAIPLHKSGHASENSTRGCRYGALDRAMIFRVAKALSIPAELVYHGERIVAQELFFILKESESGNLAQTEPPHDQTLTQRSRSALASAASKSKWLRYAGAGAGLVIGGVAIGLTGGLAAPVLAPLLVTLTGGGLGFLASSGGAVLIGAIFGVAGGGLTGYRAQRRLEGVKEFEFVRISPSQAELSTKGDVSHVPSLHATIVCSGFLLKPTDYKDPWESAYGETIDGRDVFAIKLETAALLAAGKSLENYVRDVIMQQGAIEILKRTVLASVMSAVALPAAFYKAAAVTIDNEFQRVRDKCEKAAILLADMIEADAHGERPLTLVGSSMGAITIFRALLELAKRGVTDTVDQVVLIGAPISPSSAEWEAAKSVVARRIVNVYSSDDWVLGVLVRLHSLLSLRMSTKVSGLGNVGVSGVEEVDVSDLVSGHLDLGRQMVEIMKRVGMNE